MFKLLLNIDRYSILLYDYFYLVYMYDCINFSLKMENYYVLEIIGEGFFGKVYKGRKKYFL